MEHIHNKQSLEEDLSDLRMESVRWLRDMRTSLKKRDYIFFSFYSGKYKNAEKDYYSKCREMFPKEISNKHEHIMIDFLNRKDAC